MKKYLAYEADSYYSALVNTSTNQSAARAGNIIMGPWRLLPSQDLIEIVAPSKSGGPGKLIASLSESPFDISICESHARLIAAAPELLKACELALSIWDGNPQASRQDTILALRSALSKALQSPTR